MAWWAWLVVELAAWTGAALVAVLCWWWLTRPRVDAPGPPTLPLVGNILDFREMPVTIAKLRDFHRQYGDLTRFYFGPVLVLMVAHPEDVQQILLTSRMVERDYFTTSTVRLFIGDGLLTVNGRKWRMHRKLINPTFHMELLEGFLEDFHRGSLFLVERLARTGGAPTEVHPPLFLTALRTVCNTVLGIDPDLLIPDHLSEEDLFTAMNLAMNNFQKMLTRPWLQTRFLQQLTTVGRSMFQYTELLQQRAMQCIDVRARAAGEGNAKTRLRLLEALVRPGGETALPLTEVRDELVHLILVGTETTAVTISFALAMLALHPEWQDAAQKELREVFGEGDDYLRPALMADLGRLRVLESVIKETMRLFPPAPVLPRVATEEVRLSKGRVLVPMGARLVVMPFLTHRLPEFFPEPLKFDPSRFLEGTAGREHMCSYIPFGLGARNCVGAQYARVQLRVLLADLLRRFRFLPHSRREDLEDSILSISQQPVKPITVSCVPLQGPATQH